jgi:hypothetical protein
MHELAGVESDTVLGVRQAWITASEKLLQIREKGNGCVTDIEVRQSEEEGKSALRSRVTDLLSARYPDHFLLS